MLQKVVDTCRRTAAFIEDRSNLNVQVVVLSPEGDPLNKLNWRVPVVEGPELDVLTRYVKAAKQYKADYIVRITSDCPEIPSALIHKHIFTCVNNSLDYTANVFDKARTYPDGWDTEVMSKKLLAWLDEAAIKPEYREHVTNILQDSRPDWARIGIGIGYGDNSHLKLSIDDKNDLEFANMYIDLMQSKIDWAKNNAEVIFRW